jgi:phosphate transport system ATP-binding protein
MKGTNVIKSIQTMTQQKISAKNVQVRYGDVVAIKDVSVDIAPNTVTAFIGPSGCGKSTFLRCLNRMNDTIDSCQVTGDIRIDNEDIYDRNVDPVQLRAKVGMVIQKKNPTRFRNPSLTMWPMARKFMASPATNRT